MKMKSKNYKKVYEKIYEKQKQRAERIHKLVSEGKLKDVIVFEEENYAHLL